ncbi:MAG: epoxyqueuosine reductase QueH [Christensenellales bacterium]
MNQINYDRQMQAQIGSLPSGSRPTLLLHSCCGPCSSAVLERLAPHFDITVFSTIPTFCLKRIISTACANSARLLRHMVLPWPIAMGRAV